MSSKVVSLNFFFFVCTSIQWTLISQTFRFFFSYFSLHFTITGTRKVQGRTKHFVGSLFPVRGPSKTKHSPTPESFGTHKTTMSEHSKTTLDGMNTWHDDTTNRGESQIRHKVKTYSLKSKIRELGSTYKSLDNGSNLI